LEFSIRTGRMMKRLSVAKPVINASLDIRRISPNLKGVKVVITVGRIQNVRSSAAKI
jgi:hypothetical protein